MNDLSRYRKAVAYLEGLSNLPMENEYMLSRRKAPLYVKRMRHFLGLVGDPQRGFKYVHITGTSGKGSVSSMIHGSLVAAGKRAGLFTSPFVTATIEKFKVGDRYISTGEFADIVEELKPAIDKAYLESPYGRPSYFELCLAVALVYFKRTKCEWVVLEVGCGGRFDATNVIEHPAATAITNIDYDHIGIIGDNLREIAYEKVDIVKRGTTFFTTERRKQFQDMFARECAKAGARMAIVPKQAGYRAENEALVRAICEHIGLDEAAIGRGIRGSRMPARFEAMQKEPLVVIDGAHNRAKMRSTGENVRGLSYKKMHLVIGMADNKDHKDVLREIVPLADSVHLTRFEIKERKCAHPKQLSKEAKEFLKKGSKVSVHLDPHQALDEALAKAGKDDLVLVTGSFFLAGGMRERWYPEERVLRARRSFGR